MTTLTTATTQLITSYGNTARNIIHAWGAGNERMLGFLDQRWESALERSGKALSSEVRGNALRAQQRLSALYTRGCSLATDGADAAADAVSAPEDAKAGTDAAAPDAAQPSTLGSCSYKNLFSKGDECKSYTGTGWTATSAASP